MNEANLKARQVSAMNGWLWIKQGFALVMKNPGMWLVLFAIYLLISAGLSLLTIAGAIVVNLLAPVFVAGFMWGARAQENNQMLEINHLFMGFKQHTARLVALGGIYFSSIIVIAALMLYGTNLSLLSEVLSAKQLNQVQLANALGPNFFLTSLIGLALMLPLAMAYWFAPVLVAFHEFTPLEAMKQSLIACTKNMLPFLVYGLIAMGLLALVVIPFGLGVLAMIVVIPVMTASLYTSYEDVFNDHLTTV